MVLLGVLTVHVGLHGDPRGAFGRSHWDPLAESPVTPTSVLCVLTHSICVLCVLTCSICVLCVLTRSICVLCVLTRSICVLCVLSPQYEVLRGLW